VSTSSLAPLASAVLRVPGRPERILEVGCGEGEGVLFLAREFPSARVRGVDRSAEAIHTATGRVGLDPEGRVAFKRAGVRSLPYPDGFFDLVVHSRGPLLAGELARVLRGGGCLLLIGPRRVLRPRLARRGLVLAETGEAGGVPFQLARLGGGEATAE
jgi:23S rRNA (guanine745-N1)-methyltransferase